MEDLDKIKEVGGKNMAIACIRNIKNLLHLDSEEEAADLANENLRVFSTVAQNLCDDKSVLCAAMANYGFVAGLKQRK